MQEAKSTQALCEGWRHNWSLSSPHDTLLREILSPLDVQLGETPGILDIRTPHLRAELAVQLSGNTACQIFAGGIRLRRETESGTSLFSCFKPDPTTLIVETDDPRIVFGSDGDITESDDDSVITASAKAHHLVMLVDWRSKPVRMVIISGTGEPTMLVAKARTHFVISAHQQLDACIHDVATSPGDIAPLDYLKSRLRPASLNLANPWLADDHEEPVWDTVSTYLVQRAFAWTIPDFLPALVDNLLEHTDDQGHLPTRGGNKQPIERGDTPSMTLVAEAMMMARRYGAHSADEQQLTKAANHLQTCVSTGQTALQKILRRRELELWLNLQTQAARPTDDLYRSILREKNEWELEASGVQPPWAPLLIDKMALAIPVDQIPALLSDLLPKLEDPSATDFAGLWACALMIEEPVASPIPVEVKSEWRNKLIALARKNWTRCGNQTSTGHPMRHDITMLVLATACSWANHAEAADKAHSRHRTQRMLWRINRRQRALVWLGVGMAAAFIIWLISVQLRTSLPEAAFRTRVGMIQQHYQSGEFDIAMEKLAELERRQSISEHIILFVRGKIQFKLGEIDSAIESFNHALEIEPAHAATRFNLGLCYFRKTDYGRARDLFTGLATDVALTHPATASRAKKAADLCNIIVNGEANAE